MSDKPVRAVLWDFGGVITESPFVAFARHEREMGLPDGFIRSLNTRNPDTNAWAKFERDEIDLDAFCPLFESEALEAGHVIDGRTVVALLAGPVRPEMVAALRSVRERYRIKSEEHTSELQSLMRISYAVFCLKTKIHNKIKLQD